jgi:hypothetical protein
LTAYGGRRRYAAEVTAEYAVSGGFAAEQTTFATFH